MDGQPKPWCDPPHRDPERAADELRLKFGRVTSRIEWRVRRVRRKRLRRALGIVTVWSVVLGSASLIGTKVFSPWPVAATLQHLAAFPGCAAARAIGVAPARRGRPGYWGWQDPDGDGVTCDARVRPAEPGVYRVR
jgi:hypothetical protein